MKTIITCLFLCITIGFSSFAQEKNESREKIKALKIAYLTEKLALTTSEAEKFWPIYNSFDKEQHELRYKQRYEIMKAIKEKGDVDAMDEKEAEKLINLKLATDKQLYESQKEFVQKIKNIISYKKVMKLQIAEMEFSRKLLRKYHQGDKKD
ncbi:sensor of ECF-type sigma factor [Polaribacter sp. BAL334]|uniref:sensor of ECF-type sigma factor n=1 Tax=Polaribacter sp. BAL334 TaxID=1708178 RepID=UPI0018D23129|nr:sensor of ECF-type sigma factor [Polaribacter sp. BAL334]MBG7613016.1 sensor of ECF-type sigma factor [Polaribacter sp. BAL334]